MNAIMMRLAEKPFRSLAASSLAAILLALFFIGQASALETKASTKQTAVGEPSILRLEGKPKMGYFWRLNKDMSSGLELIEIDRLGWTFSAVPRGSASFTKPGVLRYAITPKRAGSAVLVFEYFRKETGASPSARRSHHMDISPADQRGN